MNKNERVATSVVYGSIALAGILLGLAIMAEGFIGFPILLDGVEPLLNEQSWPVADLMAVLPMLFFVTALLLGGLVVYGGVSFWVRRYESRERVMERRLRRIALKTEVEKAGPHEGTEGPSQS